MTINFTPQQRQALLTTLGQGRQNAIGARKLAQLLGYPQGGNQVQLRSLIKECIEVDSDLIGVTTVNELETYLDSLENRTRSDNTRRTALITSWNKQANIPNTTKQTLTIKEWQKNGF